MKHFVKLLKKSTCYSYFHYSHYCYYWWQEIWPNLIRLQDEHLAVLLRPLTPLTLSISLSLLTFWLGHLCGLTQPMKVVPKQLHHRLWASVTHLRMDLYLQHRTRKQLVNPFSLRPLICSYLLQQPEKSQGIFSSLLPIDPALRKSAPLSKHYWSFTLNDRLSHQCIKGLDELKFHFRQLVPVIFTLFFNSWEQALADRYSESR